MQLALAALHYENAGCFQLYPYGLNVQVAYSNSNDNLPQRWLTVMMLNENTI